ncbi:MAG: hypothetical protein NWE96_10730 [Candidatus Bathyarchaeota archaeon]|nr:hypothetical protein [Candidatus Bathyarchaeota archaeon]
MSLADILGQMLLSGKVTVSTNNVESIEIRAANKKIDVNAVNKTIVKEALKASRTGGNQGLLKSLDAVRNNLDMLRGVAEELSDAGVTVTLSYKGDLVATLGSEAKPKLSSVVTGTKAIEINNPIKLIELGL